MQNTNDFINTMTLIFLRHCIIKPIGIFNYNRPSLVSNVFVNFHDKETFSEKIIDRITDHLSNFVIIKNMNNILHKQKIRMRDRKNQEVDQEKYLNDIEQQFRPVSV